MFYRRGRNLEITITIMITITLLHVRFSSCLPNIQVIVIKY